jgi:photosystem II stability/assembly factor-like uncharacterized protein
MMAQQALVNSYSRVWFQEGGAGPSKARTYHGNWQAGAVSWDKGDLTTIREPDPNSYGKFIRVGRFRGEPGDPELPLRARYTQQRSVLLRAARRDCAHTLQVHIGTCRDPQDFARGWEKTLILEEAAITSYGTDDLGALGPDETAPINEDVPFTGTDLYEVTRLNFSEQGGALVTREITSVYVCDSEQCGACGVSSDGCQVVLALEGAVSASPGLAASLLLTTDGGATWVERSITTLAATERGDRVFCVGSNVIVISSASESLHYAPLADLVANTATWTEVTTGFVATKGPIAAWTLGATETWFVGEGGYIYYSADPTGGVEVSDAGSVTTSDLNDVHFVDGGVTWTELTGPAVGVVLNAVWMKSPTEWLVGTAGGALYYTVDSGVNWTIKAFPGSGAGSVRDIVFVTPSVGYMAHSTATPAGRILRTIDGGYSWYVLPEGSGAIPENDYVGQLAVCVEPNIVFGGGLGGNAVDGFLVKAA